MVKSNAVRLKELSRGPHKWRADPRTPHSSSCVLAIGVLSRSLSVLSAKAWPGGKTPSANLVRLPVWWLPCSENILCIATFRLQLELHSPLRGSFFLGTDPLTEPGGSMAKLEVTSCIIQSVSSHQIFIRLGENLCLTRLLSISLILWSPIGLLLDLLSCKTLSVSFPYLTVKKSTTIIF